MLIAHRASRSSSSSSDVRALGPPRFLRGRERTLKGHRRRGPDRIEVLAYQIFDLLVEIREARFRQAPHVAAIATSTPGLNGYGRADYPANFST